MSLLWNGGVMVVLFIVTCSANVCEETQSRGPGPRRGPGNRPAISCDCTETDDVLTVDCEDIDRFPSPLPDNTAVLDLEDNEITEIDFNDVYSVKELTELKLSGNPLECGCKLKWLYMALTAGDSDLAGVTITGAACKVTDSAELIPVEEHSETDFECETSDSTCPVDRTSDENGVYNWKQTKINRVAVIKCPSAPPYSRLQARRRCSSDEGIAVWEDPETDDCSRTDYTRGLSNLAGQRPSRREYTFYALPNGCWPMAEPAKCMGGGKLRLTLRSENRREAMRNPDDMNRHAFWGAWRMETAPGIAKKLYNLTSAAEYFAATDMYLAVDVIDSLVIGDDSGTSDEVARDLLNSVDDLVRVDWGVMVSSQRSGKTASRLLKAIDKLARNVNSTMIDTENIGMNVVSIDPDDFDGMTFDSDSGERSNRRASIKLPALLLSGLPRELVKAQFISYKSNNFFMAVDEALTNDTSDEAESGSMYGTLNSAVIGASIGNVSITDLEEPVKITLAKINGKSGESTCVFWDFELNDDDGGWSPEGCSVSDDGDAEVVCECNHLTNFAVLSAEVSMAVKLSGSISLFVLLVSTWLFSTLV